MHQRGQANHPIKHAVWGHQDAVQVGIFSHPFQFGNAANVRRVGPDDVDRMGLDQLFEVLPQINLFAGVNGRGWWRG